MGPAEMEVLVVEDEALLRMGMVDYLEDQGFKVYEAANATEAIELLIVNLGIRMMFTDIDMPGGVDGLKLAAAVRDRWPPIKIVVTSGFRMVKENELPVQSRFFPKPYDPEAVVQAMRSMLTT